MLAQELSGIYKPKDTLDPNAPINHFNIGNKAGYNPMHLQREQVELAYEEKSHQEEEDTHLPPASTASTSTAAGAGNNKC